MHRELLFGYSVIGLLAIACSGKTGVTPANCSAGSERCACYGNGTCNEGLECRSDLCVAGGTGGSTGATTNSGGTSNIGGAGARTGGNPALGGDGNSLGGNNPGIGGVGLASGGNNPAPAGGVGGFCVNCAGGNGPFATGGTVSILNTNYCNGLLSGQVCSQPSLQADVNKVNMLLVIDESGSMREMASTNATTAKWAEMNLALAEVLPSFVNDVNFGLELFPYDPAGAVDTTNPDSSCGVALGAEAIAIEIAPGAANLTAILDQLRSQTPAGGTPISKALQQALTYFAQGNGRGLAGSKRILLATDGGPNCNAALQCTASACTQNLDGKCGDGSNPNLNCCDTGTASGAANKANLSCLDDVSAVTQIVNLKAIGVQTYVVGLPGSEVYASTLNSMAVAGGVPNPNFTNGPYYYAVSTSNNFQGMKDALTGIIAPLAKTCDFTLSHSPGNLATVQVAKDCQFIPPLPGNEPSGPDAGSPDGYYIDYSQNPAHLVLAGSYCQSIISLGATHLDVIEGCYNAN